MSNYDTLMNDLYIENENSKQKLITFILLTYMFNIYIVSQIYFKYRNELLLGLCIFILWNLYIHFGFLIIKQKIKEKYTSQRLILYKSKYKYIENIESYIINKILIKKFNYLINETCSICLENNCNIKILCNHYYCSKCLTSWIKKNNQCPMCRKLIIDNLEKEINNEIEKIK